MVKSPAFWFACIALVAYLLLGSPAKAADWDTTDKVLYGTFVGLQVVDGLQTSYASHHPEQFREANPLLGSRPSDTKIILVKALVVGGVTWAIKDETSTTRKAVLGVLDVIYISVVAHNASIGVRVQW